MFLLQAVFRNDPVGTLHAEFSRAGQVDATFLLVFQVDQEQSAVEIRIAEIRIELDGAVIAAESVDQLGGQALEIAQVEMDVRDVGQDGRGGLHVGDRFGVIVSIGHLVPDPCAGIALVVH